MQKTQRCRFHPWIGKIRLEKEMATHWVFLPRRSHGQRSLAGYSPWVAKSRTQMSRHTISTPYPSLVISLDFLAIRFVASLWQLTLPWWAVWWLWDHWFVHLSLQKVGDEGRMDLHWSSSSLPPRMERVQVSHLTGFPPVCLSSLFPPPLFLFFLLLCLTFICISPQAKIREAGLTAHVSFSSKWLKSEELHPHHQHRLYLRPVLPGPSGPSFPMSPRLPWLESRMWWIVMQDTPTHGYHPPMASSQGCCRSLGKPWLWVSSQSWLMDFLLGSGCSICNLN